MDKKKLKEAKEKFEKQQRKKKSKKEDTDDKGAENISDKDFRRFLGCGG